MSCSDLTKWEDISLVASVTAAKGKRCLIICVLWGTTIPVLLVRCVIKAILKTLLSIYKKKNHAYKVCEDDVMKGHIQPSLCEPFPSMWQGEASQLYDRYWGSRQYLVRIWPSLHLYGWPQRNVGSSWTMMALWHRMSSVLLAVYAENTGPAKHQ